MGEGRSMKCEFCRVEIEDDALACPHCQRDTATGRSRKSSRTMKVVLWVVGAPIAALVVLAIFGSQLPDKTPGDRINEACDHQYYGDTEEATRCKLALTVKALDDQRSDQLERAARSAGVRP